MDVIYWPVNDYRRPPVNMLDMLVRPSSALITRTHDDRRRHGTSEHNE